MWYVADFETTIYPGQTFTEVWAAAICSGSEEEDGVVFNNLPEFLEYCFTLQDPIIYFHNLAFDGQFILAYLYNKASGFTQQLTACPHIAGEKHRDSDWIDYEWKKSTKNWNNRGFSFVLSEKNQFYIIRIKKGSKIIEIRDSLKLLPMSVKEIGKSFQTKHQKGLIEYTGFRQSGERITKEEREYILNDVYVVKEALQQLYAAGIDRITIGSNCMADWKKRFRSDFGDIRNFFPDLSKIRYNREESVDAFCRQAYKGGWCYLKPEYAGKVLNQNGYTLDVNSLYPSRMHSESGCKYPYGTPVIWHGNYIPDEAIGEDRYYYLRFKCRFEAKAGMLPTVQIKRDTLYDGREWLLTSDIYNPETGKYTQYVTRDGNTETHIVTLTMTKTDWILFNEHYEISNLTILGGCWFHAAAGFFDSYLDDWNQIKMTSSGGRRQIAKLFMNSLYGKTAASDDSSFKYIDGYRDNGALCFRTQEEHNKPIFYIPVGAAITSYCRDFTIRAAQRNYKNFVYADTDSLHMIGNVEDAAGVELDSKRFNCWKHEADWDQAVFVQQKRYIERVDGRYDVKCAGMKRDCKARFSADLDSGERSIYDFKKGLVVPGNLKAKLIKGGVILEEREYTMR